jgi:hypothetical protein
MSSKRNKLILFEGDIVGGRGHHLDNLIETSIFFSKEFDIVWFVNSKFNQNNLFIPKYVKIRNVIKTNNISRIKNKIIYLCLEILIYINNFLFFIRIAIKKKKIFFFLKFWIKSFFTIPQYFKSFYSEFIKQEITEYDHLIIQSCREKDISLVYFLVNIENIVPKIHIRLLYPPKKKIKGFFFYLKNIKKFIDDKKIFIYTEIEYFKDLIEKQISNLNDKIFVFTNIFTFFIRSKTNNLTIGFIGEARSNKGFNLLPHFINKINSLNKNVNFLIQFSKVYPDTVMTRELLKEMAYKIPNLKIIEKYCDFFEYREILQNIDIMPILYPLSQTNTVGSGVFYSCLTNEIPIIIPRNSIYLKKLLNFSSYEEASEIDEYVEKTILITKNYNFYLSEAKKQSLSYKLKLESDPLVKNITKNDFD